MEGVQVISNIKDWKGHWEERPTLVKEWIDGICCKFYPKPTLRCGHTEVEAVRSIRTQVAREHRKLDIHVFNSMLAEVVDARGKGEMIDDLNTMPVTEFVAAYLSIKGTGSRPSEGAIAKNVVRLAEAGGPRLSFDEPTQRVTLDGNTHYIENPKVFRVLFLLVSERGPLTKKQISERVAGTRGEKTVSKLLKTLPPPLSEIVKTGQSGYNIVLPERP